MCFLKFITHFQLAFLLIGLCFPFITYILVIYFDVLKMNVSLVMSFHQFLLRLSISVLNDYGPTLNLPLGICTSNTVPEVKEISCFKPQLLKIALFVFLFVRYQISHIQYLNIFYHLKIMIKICISSVLGFSSVEIKYYLHRNIFYLAS